MSRIGKQPIIIPENVTVTISGQTITVKGPKGELIRTLDADVEVTQEGNEVIVKKKSNSIVCKQKWGLSRTLVNNMVIGVTEAFKKNLDMKGVGYKAIVKNGFLNLSLGYSHDIKFQIPKDVEIKCPKATEVELISINKESVGQAAAVIRGLRPPEPYKGKGIKYDNEFIIRKEGKK